MVLFPIYVNSNVKLAATRNVKAIRPLLDRVLVSRIKAEPVCNFLVPLLKSRKRQVASLFRKNHRKSYLKELFSQLALADSIKMASEFPWTSNQVTGYEQEICSVNQ